MLDINNKSMCVGCTACKNICPKSAIQMIEDKEGFIYPTINLSDCSKCGLCKKVCPILNLKEEETTLPKAYSAYNRDERIRSESSSGGIFTEISKVILQQQGVVFGAVFDEKFNVKHYAATKEEDLEKIRGSKYIQSDIKDSYKEAKKYLLEGKKVLFTGTPCQVEGLHAFLGKEYENLYTQDLICHGVPSKKAWIKYLDFRRKLDKGILQKVSFRNKLKKGWSNYQLSFTYDDKIIDIDHNEDLYMKIFLRDVALRPSCYECKFKKKHRKSDITLADFWGIDNVIPSMNDEKGTSLVIVNSAKGETLLSYIANNIKYEAVDFENAIEHNKSMIKSANIEKRREDFINDLDNLEFEEIIEKYKFYLGG